MKPDIILHGAEGSIVGVVPGLRGKKDVEEAIEKLSPTKGLWQKRNTPSMVNPPRWLLRKQWRIKSEN